MCYSATFCAHLRRPHLWSEFLAKWTTHEASQSPDVKLVARNTSLSEVQQFSLHMMSFVLALALRSESLLTSLIPVTQPTVSKH